MEENIYFYIYGIHISKRTTAISKNKKSYLINVYQ